MRAMHHLPTRLPQWRFGSSTFTALWGDFPECSLLFKRPWVKTINPGTGINLNTFYSLLLFLSFLKIGFQDQTGEPAERIEQGVPRCGQFKMNSIKKRKNKPLNWKALGTSGQSNTGQDKPVRIWPNDCLFPCTFKEENGGKSLFGSERGHSE